LELRISDFQKSGLAPAASGWHKTNVDLTHVRFNQIQYSAHDLENAVFVPSRDELPIDTWLWQRLQRLKKMRLTPERLWRKLGAAE
jgi:hypothetical protein